MSWWMVAAAAVVVALIVCGATSWLFDLAATARDVGAARVEAVKTGLGIGTGSTGIFALLLAVRRQWHSEIDTTEKNVAELYAKAADQLGSDKAAAKSFTWRGMTALSIVGSSELSGTCPVVRSLVPVARVTGQ